LKWKLLEWRGLDWLCLAHNRNQSKVSANAAMNLRSPQKAREFLDQLSDSEVLASKPVKQLNKAASFVSSEVITNLDNKTAAVSKHKGARKYTHLWYCSMFVLVSAYSVTSRTFA
jgi:hypothetical protein